jgi:hypothetical protein
MALKGTEGNAGAEGCAPEITLRGVERPDWFEGKTGL